MQAAFSSSLRALAAERGRGLELAIVLVLALLLAWGGWMARAEVVLVEVSVRASIESVAAAVPVTTLAPGRVAEVRLGLGRRVAAGELLVTLETGRLQLEREGQVAEIAGLRAQLAASEREHAAVAAAVATHERGGRARSAELQASAREAAVEAALAASLAAHDRSLAESGVESAETVEHSQGHWPASSADLAEAEAVCRELGLGDLLARMPGGLMQMVGETGWQLSHGERSRVYLARALLQHVDLVVLDESFAALDPTNLQRALRCVHARTRAVLAIAHP